MKLFILAVIVITVLFGVALMKVANDVSAKRNSQLNEVMKDLK